MKSVIKLTKLFTILLILFSLSSCKKKVPALKMVDAVITGYDMRLCACCGGLLINFENNPEKYSGNYYLINSLPPNSGIDENSKFPVKVLVQYTIDKNRCNSNFVDILKIEVK